jgi:hypothetical protein
VNVKRARIERHVPGCAAVLRSVAVLSVVLLPIDAARLLIRFVPEVTAFSSGHDPIRFGAGFDTVQVSLAGGEAACLRASELAVRYAVVNPPTLVVFALVDSGRACRNGGRQGDRESETDAREECRLLHVHLR